MGVKIRGLDQVKQRLNALVGEVQGRKVGRAIKSAMFIVGADAATMTPIGETSALINSQYQEIVFNGTRITGRIGYSSNYALYVHEASGKLKGKPRSSVQSFTTGDGRVAFGYDQGNFWDPAAEPKFLEKSLKENRDKVVEIIRKELSS